MHYRAEQGQQLNKSHSIVEEVNALTKPINK
jgi:hypothetical protein